MKDLLARLHEKHGRWLDVFCRRLCSRLGLRGEAQDLSQETWHKVARRPQADWPRLDDAVAWRNWLAVIARNSAVNRYVEKKRQARREREYAARRRRTAAPADLPDEETRKEAFAYASKHATWRMRLVRRLREEGLTEEAIAEVFGYTRRTIERDMASYVKLVRRGLEGRGGSAR